MEAQKQDETMKLLDTQNSDSLGTPGIAAERLIQRIRTTNSEELECYSNSNEYTRGEQVRMSRIQPLQGQLNLSKIKGRRSGSNSVAESIDGSELPSVQKSHRNR